MNVKQRKRIVDRYMDSLMRFGHHPNALYWSGREIQELRFKILAEIGIQPNDSVLDVGCGFADFKGWFNQQGNHVCFTGIDLSPDLLRIAAQSHPDATFLCGELFDFSLEHRQFDWVILSGAMNEQLHDDGVYARRMIEKMYRISRHGLAFNLLDARYLKAHDLQSIDPQLMLEYCRTLCVDVELRDDYLRNDFTIYMRC